MNNSTDFSLLREDVWLLPYQFKVAFFAALLTVALISILGNVLVIIAFLKTRSLRTSTNFYITSMAASDLLFVITNWTLYSRDRPSVFQLSQSSFTCKLGIYLSYISYSVSVTSLVFITVDRFIAAVFPMNVAAITAGIRAAFILLTWVIPMGIFFPYFQFSRKSEEYDRPLPCGTDIRVTTNIICHTLVCAFYYLIPLVVITILNFFIMKSLQRTNPAIQANSHITTSRREQNKRIMKVLISINVFFFVCWTPNWGGLIIFKFSKDIVEAYKLEMLFVVFYYFLPFLSTAVSPVILLTFSSNYRQALKNCLQVCAVFVKCRSCFKTEQAALQENVQLPELHVH